MKRSFLIWSTFTYREPDDAKALHGILQPLLSDPQMIRHEIFLDKNYALIQVEGYDSFEDYINGAEAFRLDPHYGRNLHRVCDFTRAEMSQFNVLDFIRFFTHLKKLPVSRLTKAAIVGTNESLLLKLFVNQLSTMQVRLFRDVDAAINWVVETAENSFDVLLEKSRIHQIDGSLTIADAIAKQEAWIASEQFDANIPIIWDLRTADLLASMPEIQKGAAQMNTNRLDARGDGHAAIVVKSKQQEIALKNALKASLSDGGVEILSSNAALLDWIKRVSPNTVK